MNTIKPKDKDRYHLLPSRQCEAREQNIDYYFTGEPCKKDHISVRGARSGTCYECTLSNNRKKFRQYIHKCLDADIEALITQQDNKCGICNKNLPKRYHIDHCHETGFIRGILCGRCNWALGLFQDNQEVLESAIGYLKQPKTKLTYKA